MTMLKSCKYCGGIHDRKYICPSKPVDRRLRDSKADKFRNTNAWKVKRQYIKDRDKHLCQVCLRNLYHTITRYSTDTQVHHIIPIHRDFDRRLDNINLITLCRMHHEAAEKGDIPDKLLLSIAEEQEEKNTF